MPYLVGGLLASILLFIAVFALVNPLRTRRRNRRFGQELRALREAFSGEEYEKVIDMLASMPVLRVRYKLNPDQRRKIIEIEILSLEKLHRVEHAVVSLAHHLSAVYKPRDWPKDLLAKWLSLYRTCVPITIEKFYFCETCGLHPDTETLLRYAADQGCQLPLGFPGKSRSALVIHLDGRKG